MQWIGSRSTTRAGGRWDAHGRLPTRQSAALLILCSSLHHLPPPPPPRAFGPMGSEYVDARAMSASITTSILVALRPQHLSSLGLFIKQVVTSCWPPTPELQSVTQATILLGHVGDYDLMTLHESTNQDGSITLQSQRTDPHAFSYQHLKVCFGINGFRKGPHVVLDSADTLI
ncbi:unnamed protein product [Musa acuminata subsp. burmannicoides]